MIDLDSLKVRLSDLPGLTGLSRTDIGGKIEFGFNGLLAIIDPRSSIDDAERAIRKTYATRPKPPPTWQIETPMPTSTNQPQGRPMSTPAPGSFSASLKAMIDEAKAGLEKARADGQSRVTHAVVKLNDAKESTTKVATGLAQQIEDAAADAMADLGQISNEI